MKIFDYDDIQLIPEICTVKSRKQCDTSIALGKNRFKLPVVLANMASIINETLAEKLSENNYFYIMHRFKIDSFQFVKNMKTKQLITSISIGIKLEDFNLITKLAQNQLVPDYITIDIAHGHSITVKLMIEHIRRLMGNNTFIIAGNVATPNAVRDLESWGADATKIGIGPGKVCITKSKTGFGTGGWQLSAVNWCSKVAQKPIIADGGIRFNGDIAKSIRFGANFCMIGSLFAAHLESPGEVIEMKDNKYKAYYGSASEFNKQEKRYIEGKKEHIKLKGSIFTTLNEMKEDLQSSISYAGGSNINAIKKVNYIILKKTTGLV